MSAVEDVDKCLGEAVISAQRVRQCLQAAVALGSHCAHSPFVSLIISGDLERELQLVQTREREHNERQGVG